MVNTEKYVKCLSGIFVEIKANFVDNLETAEYHCRIIVDL